MRKVYREPLTYFLLFGGLLFGAERLAAMLRKPQIVLDQATMDALVLQREERDMRVLTPEERQIVIDDWLADEILLREAYRRGLDRDDRIRRALILKMRSAITGELPAPSEETLRAWFDSNSERYVKTDGEPLGFDEARPYLQGDWLMEQSRRAVRAEVSRLLDDYRIVIEAG